MSPVWISGATDLPTWGAEPRGSGRGSESLVGAEGFAMNETPTTYRVSRFREAETERDPARRHAGRSELRNSMQGVSEILASSQGES